jgi:TonB family protein
LRSGPPGDGGETRGGFVVSSEVPRLLNALEVQRSLERNYPPFLRDAGIGGEVTLWLLIDENGRVVDTDIRERSGHPALDEAAVKVGEIIRFSPGMNRAARVKVWVSLPIRFKTQ